MQKTIKPGRIRFVLFLSSLLLLCSTSWLIIAELHIQPNWIKMLIFVLNTALVMFWVLCIDKKASRF